jgi:hypothetical protein
MPRASDLRLNAIKLAQDGRVLTATAVAPPLNFVTTEFTSASATLRGSPT